MTSALPPALEERRREIDALVVDVDRLTADLGARRMNWSPDAGSWSIGQCIDHLNTVDGAYADRLERAIERRLVRHGRRGPRGTQRPRVLERFLARSIEPGSRVRMSAPSSVAPPSQVDPAEVTATFRARRERLARLVDAGRHLDLSRVKIRSPILPLLRLSVVGALAFLAAHDRRHVAQAWRVRWHERFPTAPTDPSRRAD